MKNVLWKMIHALITKEIMNVEHILPAKQNQTLDQKHAVRLFVRQHKFVEWKQIAHDASTI